MRKAICVDMNSMNMAINDNDIFHKEIIKAITNLESKKRNDTYKPRLAL